MKVLVAMGVTACLALGASQAARAADDAGKFRPTPPKPAVTSANDSVAPSHGVPMTYCKAGFTQQGSRLCMTGYMGTTYNAYAQLYCMDLGARVADYHDWFYRRWRGDGIGAPVGWWLGGIIGDNTALFANSADWWDGDGNASRFDSRGYACAYDLIR